MEENDFFENLKFEEGGEMKSLNWEDFKDKIVILRVQPPSTDGGGGGEEELPDDNIIDPFDEEGLDKLIREGGEDDDDGDDGDEKDDGKDDGKKRKDGKQDDDGGGKSNPKKDLDKIQTYLKSENLKQDFRTRKNVENAIGNVQLFLKNNKQKIKEALDLIFK